MPLSVLLIAAIAVSFSATRLVSAFTVSSEAIPEVFASTYLRTPSIVLSFCVAVSAAPRRPSIAVFTVETVAALLEALYSPSKTTVSCFASSAPWRPVILEIPRSGISEASNSLRATLITPLASLTEVTNFFATASSV